MDGLLKSFHYDRAQPVPHELLRIMAHGLELVEIDEQLYFHIKFHFRSLIFFEDSYRFGIRVGPSAGDVAEFMQDKGRYYLRPPGLIEN